MLTFHQVDPSPWWWARLSQFPDQLIYHTEEWIRFLQEAQNATPVFAEIHEGSSQVGCFCGMMMSPFGIRILGSPFPGSTTMYMGFTLEPDVPRWLALQGLQRFAFHDLGCLYFEIADRLLTNEDGERSGLTKDFYSSYETDLKRTEEQVFAGMKPPCRTCIRKAQKNGVVIEECRADDAFADDYYEQLKDVFAKQALVPTYSRDHVRLFMHHLYPTGRLLLLRARDAEGNCIATGLYPGMNRLAQLWGNASYRCSQHLRPNQALNWYALRYWRARSAECFDWGGAGAYKENYGPRKVSVHRFYKARVPLLATLRDQARKLFQCKQQVKGWIALRMSNPVSMGPGKRCVVNSGSRENEDIPDSSRKETVVSEK